MDTRKVGPDEHLCVWDLVLPLYAKQFSQAGGVEVVQFLAWRCWNRPCLKVTEQGGEPEHFVDPDDLCLCNREWWVGGQAKWQSIEADSRLVVAAVPFINHSMM